MTRATRDHPDVRQGSSVRGAIDLTLVAGELLALRNAENPGPNAMRPSNVASQNYAPEAPLPGRVWAAAGTGTCEHSIECH